MRGIETDLIVRGIETDLIVNGGLCIGVLISENPSPVGNFQKSNGSVLISDSPNPVGNSQNSSGEC